jgi:hypothetical protein
MTSKGEGKPFYWCGDEPLVELERPERMEEIKRNWADKQEKAKRKVTKKLLVSILGGSDWDEEGEKEGCLICQL